MSTSLRWYVQRLRRMSAQEVLSRAGDRARQARWARRQVRPGDPFPAVPGLLAGRMFVSPVPLEAREQVSPDAAKSLVATADRILRGEWDVLGTPRPDVADPDWFRDPVTGRRAPNAAYAFAVDHRDENVTGNVKSVWELSRHHHLTVLAAAWWLTSDPRYAEAVAAQLRSWWAANPFLSGIHWTSGIELGIRLTSWVWVRRLLDSWPGVADLFEDNPMALVQIRWHQEYLAAFRSRGSSANNHVIAEAVGRLVAACAFPWFEESDGWRSDAARELHHELAANTFPSGVNREQASDYHLFATELGLVALVEAEVSGHPLPAAFRDLLVSSFDAAAAMLDASGRPPRQGDGDEGRALVLDDADTDPWAVLLGCGAATVGACDWWQPTEASVAAALLGSLATNAPVSARPSALPTSFDDAGLHILRTGAAGEGPELWCRCDGGPQGFLSIAAHGHADALSLEVRVGGVELFVDPGTYCYHGEPEWRSYFRSTRAHNTVEVDGQSQALEAGPFMWATHADAVDDGLHLSDGVQRWSAHHRGYARLDPELVHARTVLLDGPAGTLTVTDTLTGSALHTASLAWHLGPEIDVALIEDCAVLTWPGARGESTAVVRLPAELSWTVHRGESAPVLGWYSPRFGVKVPTTTLVGKGSWTGVTTLTTVLDLRSARDDAEPTRSGGAVASVQEAR